MRSTAIESDFIVVGAGSAGCAAASRLSEAPDTRVTLIEAGPDNDSWRINMPLGVQKLVLGTQYNWAYTTAPEPRLARRRIEHPRGKVIGGSSSINGMVYTRGHALDFQRWATEFGCAGWSYADVLPYFKRCETSDRGANTYRGGSGPLHVTTPSFETHPLNRAFIEGGHQVGYPNTPDSNAYCQEGFGPNEQTIYEGRRWSSANAYLSAKVRRRPNLQIFKCTRAEKLLVRQGRVMGVRMRRDDHEVELRCTREVILCAGAFGSPQLLLVSGIGPRDALARASVATVHDMPAVGRNLQDHPDWALQVECRKPVTLLPATRFPGKMVAGVMWFLRRAGVAASNQFEAAAYIRTRPGVQYPNLKLELLPLAFEPGSFNPYPMPAYQVHMSLLAAHSRGEVTLTSPDPAVAPNILFNYLSDERDLATMREAIRLTREVLTSPALAEFTGRELQPGSAIQGDDALDHWIRANLGTAYHPAGSCRMGPASDRQAVVGPDLKLHGLDGLRVADASIMPLLIAANTNATAIMIGDRVADFALGRKPLAPEPAPYWINPDWQTRQR
jgi:choline dehydrogenase